MPLNTGTSPLPSFWQLVGNHQTMFDILYRLFIRLMTAFSHQQS